MVKLPVWIQIAVLCVLGLCVSAMPSLTQYPDDSMQYRDDLDTFSDPDKPVRDDGLGSLLLKNLRFRDLYSQYHSLRPSSLKALIASHQQQSIEDPQDTKDFSKRRDMSVNELAQILNNLKARNVDGGVKLQSLRFGRRR